MIRRLLAAALTVALAIVLLIAAWPQLFHLEWHPVIAQAVSLRAVALSGAAVMIVLLLVVALVSSAARRFTGSLALVLVAFCCISLVVLATRGFGSTTFADKTVADITVLSWNTLGDAPGADTIATLALDSDADVLTLPETTEATGIEVANLMKAGGSPMWVYTLAFDQISKARSTTLLISAALGTYTVDETIGNTSTLPTVVARPDDGTGPVIVAVHPVAPVEGEMENWKADLTWLAGLCDGTNMIMAGDFNSTLDHWGRLSAGAGSSLGQCSDAAEATGNAAVGTWPTDFPALLGTPIDHVLTSSQWNVSGMRVIEDHDASGSDHRPVLAQLSPTG